MKGKAKEPFDSQNSSAKSPLKGKYAGASRRSMAVHGFEGDCGCRVLLVEPNEDPVLEDGIHRDRHNSHKGVDRGFLCTTKQLVRLWSNGAALLLQGPLTSLCRAVLDATVEYT